VVRKNPEDFFYIRDCCHTFNMKWENKLLEVVRGRAPTHSREIHSPTIACRGTNECGSVLCRGANPMENPLDTEGEVMPQSLYGTHHFVGIS